MREIAIGGTRFIADLEWNAIAGVKKSQEIRIAAKTVRKKFAVIVEGVEAVGVGFAEKPSKLPSAAAALSAAYEKKNTDFILVEPLEEGGYWVCAIRKGIPVMGYDVLSDFDGAVSRVSDLVAFGGFVVFSKDMSVAQHFLGTLDVIQEDFGSLTQGKPSKLRIKKVAGAPVLQIGAVVSLVLMGAGWFVFDSMEEERLLLERKVMSSQKSAAAAAAIVASNQEAIKKWRADYEKAKTAEIEKALSAVSLDNSKKATVWRSSLVESRVDVPGWDLQSVRCDTTICDFIYDSSRSGGINSDLVAAVGKVSFKGEGQHKARFSLRLPSFSSGGSSALPTEDEFFVAGLSELQSLSSFGIKVDTGGLIDITFSPPPLPKVQGDAKTIIPMDIQNPSKQTGLQKGTLTLKGEGIFSLIALANVLKEGQGISLLEMRTPVDLVSQQPWKIDGVFYIKKGN